LFGVASLGPALRRLEWMPVKEAEAPRRPLGLADVISQFPARRRDIRR